MWLLLVHLLQAVVTLVQIRYCVRVVTGLLLVILVHLLQTVEAVTVVWTSDLKRFVPTLELERETAVENRNDCSTVSNVVVERASAMYYARVISRCYYITRCSP